MYSTISLLVLMSARCSTTLSCSFYHQNPISISIRFWYSCELAHDDRAYTHTFSMQWYANWINVWIGAVDYFRVVCIHWGTHKQFISINTVYLNSRSSRSMQRIQKYYRLKFQNKLWATACKFNCRNINKCQIQIACRWKHEMCVNK